MIRTVVLSLLAATYLSTAPAAAQDAVSAPVTAELLQGWQMPDGTRVSAVRLRLQPGWKTYWRAPGDAGIPPSFDWKGSRNLKGAKVMWPTPKVFGQNGMKSVGYSDQVVLPIAFSARQPDQPLDIALTLDIGVCKDICIPERLRLEGTLDTASRTPDPAIAAALAERPYSAQDAGAGETVCSLAPTRDGLAITAMLSLPHTGGVEHVVIEAGRPDVWVSEAEVSRKGGTLTARAEMVPSGEGALSLDRSAIRFTVLGDKRAVDLRGCVAG